MIVAVLSAVCAPAALAKEGVVARLTAPLVTSPSGGVPVEFTLTSRENGRPFSALDVFVRVRTTDGRKLEIWPEERGSGNFAGLVRTRRSDITDLEIGLAGIASPGGRSDLMFPIANDPFPGSPEPLAAPAAEGDSGSSAALVVVIALFAIALVAFAIAVARFRTRRRSRAPSLTASNVPSTSDRRRSTA